MINEKLKTILNILQCINCGSANLNATPDEIICSACNTAFPIVDDVPRFVPKSFYQLSKQSKSLEEKTKNYFGYEWNHFANWGFYDENKIPLKNRIEFREGTSKDRRKIFDTKCRLTHGHLNGGLILDAGCGNGRYTYEAALRGTSTVIGVDLGYGSVNSAYKNTKKLKNAIIIQANLFNLPFVNGAFDNVFSNGVLQHTGDAQKAFKEISKKVKNDGIFVAHIYHKLNWVWEINDFLLRFVTTKMSIEANLKLAKIIAKFGRLLVRAPRIYNAMNLLFRIQPQVINMYDWYSAPIATHHTYPELAKWFQDCGFDIVDDIPRVGKFIKPWSANLIGRKKILCAE